MRDLIKQFVDQRLSRRDFGAGLAALGFSASAVQSVVGSLAHADEGPVAAPLRMEGTGSEVMLATLQAGGVRNIFGTTATGMSPFFDALALQSDTRMILSIAESQATSMAHGYELASGETAVLFVPGVAIPSTMNNLYNAWKDRSAIAVFSDGPSNQLPGRDAFQQMQDWLEPMDQFTKWVWQVDNTRQIGEMTRRAMKVAGTAPGGPVHVRFPLNILGAPGVRTTVYPQQNFHVPVEMRPKPELIEATAKALLEAKMPMICAGAEVTRAGANDALVELAELLGAPVAQGFSVYGDFPFRHPLFAGYYGLGVPRGLGKTDVFLNLGAPAPDPGLFTAPVPSRAKNIHARIEYETIAPGDPVTDDRVGGDGLLTGSVEYSFPASDDDQLPLLMFSDFGYVSEDASDVLNTWDQLRISLGFGARWSVRTFGNTTIEIDLSWPVREQSGDETETFQFTIGAGSNF